MIKWLGAAMLVVLTLPGSQALACVSAAPPHWPSILRADGPPIAIGRVVSVVPNAAPRTGPRFEVYEATAEIQRLETIQGETSEATHYTAALSVRLLEGQPAMDGWCGDWMRLNPGDLVLVVETAGGRTSVFSQDRAPADLLPHFEAYR